MVAKKEFPSSLEFSKVLNYIQNREYLLMFYHPMSKFFLSYPSFNLRLATGKNPHYKTLFSLLILGYLFFLLPVSFPVTTVVLGKPFRKKSMFYKITIYIVLFILFQLNFGDKSRGGL